MTEGQPALPLATVGSTDQLQVDDVDWIVTKLGEDVVAEQDKRELLENAIKAVQRTIADPTLPDIEGEVLVDVDVAYFTETGIRKLAVIDTGDAFTAASLAHNLNRLAPSGEQRHSLGTFGVGAKIAGLTRHPAGMVYQSWTGPDEGVAATLWRDDAGHYGLQRLDTGDGKFAAVVPIDDTTQHELIAARGHGTMVTLLGADTDEDTYTPPPGNRHGGKWLSRYFNSRYFELPDAVHVKVREGADYTPDDPESGRLRTVTGMRAHLDQTAVDRGHLPLDVGVAWWWILDNEDRTRDSHYLPAGHVAAVFGDELFDVREQQAGYAMLQKMGITFGFKDVVIYIEPGVTAPRGAPTGVTCDLQRAHLKVAGAPLDFDALAEQVRGALPPELRAHVEAHATGARDDADRHRRIRKLMEQYRDLFQLPRYRPMSGGPEQADPNRTGPGGQQQRGERPSRTDTQHNSTGIRPGAGSGGTVYPLRRRNPGQPSTRHDDVPDVQVYWISDVDTELPGRDGEIEDAAAKYIAETNILKINADFRLFAHVRDRWLQAYRGLAGAHDIVTDAVRSAYEQVLVETVIGMLVLRGDEQWSDRRLQRALSPEALTAATMPRVAVNRQIQATLQGRLGRPAA